MGHEELEPPQPHSIKTLPSVNERMSEETLEDVHAFTDLRNVIRQINLGGGNGGIGNGNASASDKNSSAAVGNISSSSSLNSLSREGSIAGGSYMGDPGHLLETLEEFEEEGSDDGSQNSGDGNDGSVGYNDDVIKEEGKRKLAVLKKKDKGTNEADGKLDVDEKLDVDGRCS